MKSPFFRLLMSVVVLIAVSTALAAGKQELPEFTEDGLQLVRDSKLAIVYAEPGADLSGYQRVQLLEAYVAFKKNWAREQRTSSTPLSVTSKDMDRIRSDLASGFRDVFSSALEDGGFPVVDEAGEDVLLVRPAIINLDVKAPDTRSAGMTKIYTDSAGEMTLYVELYDSVTGDLIAKALDRKADPRNAGFYTWTNSATNKAAADRILKGWAAILVSALEEARATAAATDDAEGTAPQ